MWAWVGNGIAFISTATCKNKGRNELTPGIVFASKDAAAPLCLLGKMGVNATPWGKRFIYELVKFQFLHGSFPAANLCAPAGTGNLGTFWMFPGGIWGTRSSKNIRHQSLQRPALLFLGSSPGQQGDENAHFCLRHLRHCLRHHLQFSPCASALDVKKHSF